MFNDWHFLWLGAEFGSKVGTRYCLWIGLTLGLALGIADSMLLGLGRRCIGRFSRPVGLGKIVGAWLC